MDNKGINITASMMMEYIYCKRLPYFTKTLHIPSSAKNSYKVREGKRIHKLKAKNQGEYLRKELNVKEKIVDDYLFSKKYDISGKVDEVLFLEDGTAAPLDYKYSMYKGKISDNYKIQLVFYSVLIEENYNVPVNKGYIVYIRSNNRLEELEFFDEDYDSFFIIYSDLKEILEKEIYPIGIYQSIRCEECDYRNICSQ